MAELAERGVGRLAGGGVVEVFLVLGDSGMGFGDEGEPVVIAVGIDGDFELLEGEGIDGASGLIGAVKVGGVGLVFDRAEPTDMAEALEAGVENVAGDAEGLLEFSGAGGRLPLAEALSDMEEDAEADELAGAGADLFPGVFIGQVVGVLDGVGELTAEEDEEPEDVEAEHEDDEDADGAVEAVGIDDALHVEEGEFIVEEEEDDDDGGADEGGLPMDAGIGNEAEEEGEEEGKEEEDNEWGGKAEESGEGGTEGEELFDTSGDGVEGNEGEGGGAENGAKADKGPVDDDPLGEFASAGDAPEGIEGAFDRTEDLEGDEGEHEGAEGADGAGLGGIGKVIDQFEDLRVEFRRGAFGVVFEVECDLGCGKGDGFGDGIDHDGVVAFFEGESGDEDGQCNEGADADEGVEGEGGGLQGDAVAPVALKGEGEDAENEVGAGAEVFAAEVLEFPDVFAEELTEASETVTELLQGLAGGLFWGLHRRGGLDLGGGEAAVPFVVPVLGFNMFGGDALEVFDLFDRAEGGTNFSGAGHALGQGDKFGAHPAEVAVPFFAKGALHDAAGIVDNGLPAFFQTGGLGDSAVGEVVLDVAKDPRITERGAADHDARAGGLGTDADEVFGATDVAVADDGNIQCGGGLGDNVPIGFAPVSLHFGAPVNG